MSKKSMCLGVCFTHQENSPSHFHSSASKVLLSFTREEEEEVKTGGRDGVRLKI
jgi:hypothetical protein